MKKREHTDICYVGNVDGICTQLVAFVGAVLYPEIKMCGNLPSPREEGEMMMKKNVASLLLALVLCLSLLPAAALAEEPTTGLYTEINNGAPAGNLHTADEWVGPSNDIPVYNNVTYVSGSSTTVYYYDASGESHSVPR